MSEWIKCADRLPTVGEYVLVYSPNHFTCAVAYLITNGDDEPILYCIFDFFEDHETTPLDQITHWMKLPLKPI